MRINHDVALLPDMALFAQVVEASSFSEVARKRGMTPSAVSRSIARLERATGTRLLHRTTRKLSLSEAGTEMYQHCRDMLDAARSALQVAHQREMRPAGKLRVSSPRALGRFFVHPHIAPFLRTYPDVDVELRLDDRPLDLYDGDIDLAFRVTDDPPASLMGRKLFRIEHVICATPAYLDQHGRPQHPRDLKGHSCIALSRAVDDSRWRFTRAGKTISVDIEGRYTVNHAGVRLDAVLSGIGIGSLPFFMARDALEAGLTFARKPNRPAAQIRVERPNGLTAKRQYSYDPTCNRFPLWGMKTGTGCKSPAVPATVSGESAVMKPLGISPEKATGTAMTRKPGDLPVVVVYRPARDCRTNGTSPHDGMSAL